MENPSEKRKDLHKGFTGGIGRKLSFFMILSFVVVLLIGGVSIMAARSIYLSTQEIDRQAHHVEAIDGIHATVHHLVSAVHESAITSAPYPDDKREKLVADLHVFSDEYEELEKHEGPFPEQEKELKIWGEMKKMISDLVPLSERSLYAVAQGRGVDPRDLKRLAAINTILPQYAREMTNIHHIKVDRSIQQSWDRLWIILGLYLAFLVIGCAFIFGSNLLVYKTMVQPISRLASATLEVADGDFKKRVSVPSRDEIGQLAHSFNVMAERMAENERQLKATHEQLERKAQETEALNQIGMEISSLLPVGQVIEQVVSHGRELLQADRAGLALLDEGSQEIHWRIFLGGKEEAFKGIRLKPGQGVAGRVISQGKPMIIEDVSKDPADTPEANPILKLEHLRSALAVPIRRGGHIVGALMVGNLIPSQFGDDQVRLLTGLASQAAVAIENARLYEQTGALAAVRERERIARDMHDGLAQALGYIHMHLAALEARTSVEAQGEIRGKLREIKKVAGDAYEEIRQSIFGLRTMVSRGLGFIPTLTEYLHEFSRKNGITTLLQVGNDHVLRFSPDVEVQLIRIIQEALTNIRKHAGARRAVVRFDVEGDRCCVTVRDDGEGFEPGKIPEEGPHHFGLQAMRERAEGIGGSLEIDTAPGKGTKVIIRLPL